MNIPINLMLLSKKSRAFLRKAADRWFAYAERECRAAIALGQRPNFSARARARAARAVRRGLRRRRFVLRTWEEVETMQDLLHVAVLRVDWDGRRGQVHPAAVEINRFARSLHLANVLDMRREAA